MLRIAFAMINCNRRDGSARAVNEVAERLVDRGHEVHLYARRAEDLNLEKVRWHRIPGPGWPEAADFWTYYQAVNVLLKRSRPYDIVHSIGCNTLLGNVVTIQNIQPAKDRAFQRLKQREQVSLPRRLSRAVYLRMTSAAEKKLYSSDPRRRSPMFLPVSRGVERELREHYEIGAASVRIVPNAADLQVFKPLPEEARRAWRDRHGIAPADFLILFAGGEWARKGLDLAIRALALILSNHVKLFVAGDDSDRARYLTLANELQITDRVIFGGFRLDIAECLGAGDLFLFPSYYEAFSLATIEAAACALPVVATKINGTEDFITPGITGEFIAHDPEQIAATLRPLIADLSTCRRMGGNGRELVEQNYTWDHVTKMTEDAYDDYLCN